MSRHYEAVHPWLAVSEQNTLGTTLVDHENTAPGTGISWVLFTRGSHMSTWKYGYRLDFAFEWLFSQRRDTESARGKLEQLKDPWLGRDENGVLLPGSGTEGMNSAQFTTGGASDVYVENWTPESVGTSDTGGF